MALFSSLIHASGAEAGTIHVDILSMQALAVAQKIAPFTAGGEITPF
jgi:hypothetical protein